MPQDIPESEETEPTIQRAGGTDTSADADNAGAEIATLAAEIEAGSEEAKAQLEDDIEELNAEISDLEEELVSTDRRDYEEYGQIENDLADARADRLMAQSELRALNDYGYLGEFNDRINVPPSNGSNGANRLSMAVQGQRAFDHYAQDTPISDFLVGEVLTAPLGFLKAIRWLGAANNARRAASLGRAGRLLERLRRSRSGLTRARRARGERINRRRRRRNRRCRRRGGNPVFLDNGAVSQADPIFSLSGLFEIAISSTYQSDLELRGPLGWGRVSDLDATLERLPNTKLRYIDGAGFHIDFARPTPNIGQWNPGDHIRYMEIAAGKDRSFMVREEGVIRHFKKRPDKKWYLSAVENQNGAKLSFERDSHGMLVAVETPEKLRLEFTNDAERGLRMSVDLVGTDRTRKCVMRYAYDGQDNLVLAECPFGDKHEYRYDDRHLRVWACINDQYEARYHFDDDARCVLEETNGPYDGTRFEYDPERRITKHIPGGDRERTEILYYKEDGAVFMDAHISGRINQTYYDEEGYTACEQDGNGHRTKFKYDPWGNVNSIEDPEGRISDFRWTEYGQMEYAIDPIGATWESDYDEFGNLIGSKDANGFDIQIKNNDLGQPTGICRYDGLIRFLSYSDNHWLTSDIDFDGSETSFERDAFGRLAAITEADERRTTYSYIDQEGWDFWTPSKVTLQGQVTLKTDVIKPRRQICQIDGAERATHFLIDGFGKIEATKDAKGGALKFRYDHAEELTEVENQTGQIWKFERDAMGRIVKETDFGDSVITYEYDDADRLTASTYPDGTRHEIEMDKSGLMTKETVLSPAQELLVTEYEYDGRALLKSATNADDKVEFERDANGQVIVEIINGTRIESTYDCCGRRETRTINGETVAYGYDPVGRLSKLTIGEHSPLEFIRDKSGHETERVSSMGFKLQQKFSALGLLAEQRIGHGAKSLADFAQQGAPAKPVIDRRYQWNKSLEPTVIADSRWGETRYNYDQNSQITQTNFGDGATEKFSYDARLNIEATGFQNPAAQQAQQIAERLQNWQDGNDGRVEIAQGPQGEKITLTYDAKGRVTEKHVEQNGFRPKVWHFEWNGLDRMIGSYTPDGAKWSYGYDPFARRLWKQEWVRGTEVKNGVSRIIWEKSKRHDFLWDGDVIASEIVTHRDGSSQDVWWYFEPESFVPLARKEGMQLSYVITDHLGTPREVVSEAGEVEWAAEYRTWGEIKRLWQKAPADDPELARRGPLQGYQEDGTPVYASRGDIGVFGSNGNAALKAAEKPDPSYCPIRFQGQWEDQETGLHYNRFRYYEPIASAYISSDPLGVTGSIRLYGYAKNPETMFDPDGLSLRSALGNGLDKAPWQAHHIIPVNVFRSGAGSRMLRTLGIVRDSAINGIALPSQIADAQDLGMLRHSGSHGRYTNAVRQDLARIERKWETDRRKPGNRACADMIARAEILAVQARYRAEIITRGAAMPGTTMANAW